MYAFKGKPMKMQIKVLEINMKLLKVEKRGKRRENLNVIPERHISTRKDRCHLYIHWNPRSRIGALERLK
jgi:hypothetical protein